ncbi:prepilin-type N-terminal cleavage/methylation domain-containing protein [Deltaproteobacteria bacterium]|nr:prepilin-type N-terminal cleavage/methylation domain-containing protein [Deltaproteobacteria bacterium]
MKIFKKNTIYGFTLLEVMVSLSIIAIALTALLATQSQGLSLAGEAKFGTTASLLAQSKMAEFEGIKTEDMMSDSGDFGEDFPDYFWDLEVQEVSFPGDEEFTEYLRQIDLNVYRGEKKHYRYGLRLYEFVP